MGSDVNQRVAEHRARMRAQGMKLLQIWVPDTSAPGFDEECHRQSLALANSPHAEEDQAFVDAISCFPDDMGDE
jgi:hypothetical protein